MKKIFFLLLIPFFFLIGCSKPKDEFIPVTGQFFSSIDSTLPISNTTFKFYSKGGGTGSKMWEHSQPFTTDSIGMIHSTINLNDFGAGFAICWPNGDMDNYILKVTLEFNQKSVDLGKIYTKL